MQSSVNGEADSQFDGPSEDRTPKRSESATPLSESDEEGEECFTECNLGRTGFVPPDARSRSNTTGLERGIQDLFRMGMGIAHGRMCHEAVSFNRMQSSQELAVRRLKRAPVRPMGFRLISAPMMQNRERRGDEGLTRRMLSK